MKRFIVLFSLILILPLAIYNFLPYDSLLLLGVNSNYPLVSKNNLSDTGDLINAYAIVIDSIYIDELKINPNIEYISVDTTDMINLSDKSKRELLSSLKKYNVTVFDNTKEELDSRGLISNGRFTNGVFIKIEDSPIYNDKITMKAEKWHSSECDIVSTSVTVEKSLDGWTILEINPWYIGFCVKDLYIKASILPRMLASVILQTFLLILMPYFLNLLHYATSLKMVQRFPHLYYILPH